MKTRYILSFGLDVFLTAFLLLLITVPLMFSGCAVYDTQTSSDNSQDKQYYVDRARNAIESYRVTDHNEFYGFTLGENLEGRNSLKFSQDEETGGHIYNLKDPKGVFDTVLICTDEIGEILRIDLIRELNSYVDGLEFFKTIEKKLKVSYPAVGVKAIPDEDVYLIVISAAKDDDDWIEKYSEYLYRSQKNRRYGFYNSFRYILHPMLADIKCTFLMKKGQPMFWMRYIGKEYIRLKVLQKQKIIEKLGEL